MTDTPCTHQTLHWERNNRFLVCAACQAEFKPGVCIRCSAPACAAESFVCEKHTARAAMAQAR